MTAGQSAGRAARRLWAWAKRPDRPARAGGPARPIAVTETDVTVLTAAEYPDLPEITVRPGDAEIGAHIDGIGAGIDAGTAGALDELLHARERGWLADLDARRASHQSWVDAITADGLHRKVRLHDELAEVEAEIKTLDEVVDLARAGLRAPATDRKPRRRRSPLGRTR